MDNNNDNDNNNNNDNNNTVILIPFKSSPKMQSKQLTVLMQSAAASVYRGSASLGLSLSSS